MALFSILVKKLTTIFINFMTSDIDVQAGNTDIQIGAYQYDTNDA